MGETAESRTKEYRAYVRMIHRCHNPDYEGYERYGGRGIRVCPSWRCPRGGYARFLAALGRAPSEAHTLERENNELGYGPSNCKWATWDEQNNNRRTSRHFTFRGLRMTMAQWAEWLGLSRKCLWKRWKLGWDLADMLSPWPEGKEAPECARKSKAA